MFLIWFSVGAIHESPSPIIASCGSYHANYPLDNVFDVASPLGLTTIIHYPLTCTTPREWDISIKKGYSAKELNLWA